MNNRYWLRIALGIVLVFTLGMAGISAARKGKAEVRDFLSTASTRIPLKLANIDFRLDGRPLGRIAGLDINRRAADAAARLAVQVELADLGDLEGLRDCSLVTDDIRRFSTHSTFRCARPAELAAGNLAEAGSVTFEPGNLTRPLLLPEDIVARLRHADRSNASVSIQADQHGASIKVTDKNGRKVVDIQAKQ